MDLLNMFFIANITLGVITLLGAAWTKAGVADRVTAAIEGANFAGMSGAMIGLVSVASVGAMFV